MLAGVCSGVKGVKSRVRVRSVFQRYPGIFSREVFGRRARHPGVIVLSAVDTIPLVPRHIQYLPESPLGHWMLEWVVCVVFMEMRGFGVWL